MGWGFREASGKYLTTLTQVPPPPPKSDRARMPVNLITRISDKSEIEFHLTKSIVAIDEILDSYFNRYTKPFEQISAIEI